MRSAVALLVAFCLVLPLAAAGSPHGQGQGEGNGPGGNDAAQGGHGPSQGGNGTGHGRDGSSPDGNGTGHGGNTDGPPEDRGRSGDAAAHGSSGDGAGGQERGQDHGSNASEAGRSRVHAGESDGNRSPGPDDRRGGSERGNGARGNASGAHAHASAPASEGPHGNATAPPWAASTGMDRSTEAGGGATPMTPWYRCGDGPDRNASLACPPGLAVAAVRAPQPDVADGLPAANGTGVGHQNPPGTGQTPQGEQGGSGPVEDLAGVPGTPVPDQSVDLTSMAWGPVSEAVLAAVTAVLVGASVALFGTVRAFSRPRSGPVAVTKADRDAARRLAQEAAASGLGWTWDQAETFDGLRTMDPEAVAFWTGSDLSRVARWQGDDVPVAEGEEVVVERTRRSVPPTSVRL